ncbi:sorbitol 6-phosphate dehydrogenase [Clostridium polyendosporum]|uniref:Sorbitol 6-phosphate dehydrogenase n=1 Tax=Clostridium polyendosporum TaxID=69208 RepID=A0A919S298_9CLOT|nr:sorbitol-6-phosphate dehydrogenase [Clostridium polyendosporum]GIM30534.1 sorbitol 6-phosphate dehydrogenase [Clostridium polyendosporum]
MSKVALVVGGGRSLGEYLSKHLAGEGYDVAVVDINYDNASKVSKEIIETTNKKSIAISADATNEQQVKDMVNKVVEELGRIDVLVYNAGVAKSSKITEFQLDTFNWIVNVNLTGYFLCAREVSRVMIDQGIEGSIIQINSKSGKVGSKHNTGYSAAKFAGVGLTQSLALDLAEHNIRVNSMMLGNLLDSDMFESLLPQYAVKLGIKESEVKQVYIDKVPLKRGCAFKDVADVITFYASENAHYLTGQSVNITGGQVMH